MADHIECSTLQRVHQVVIGRSWGTLPPSDQQRWTLLRCDWQLEQQADVRQSVMSTQRWTRPPISISTPRPAGHESVAHPNPQQRSALLHASAQGLQAAKITKQPVADSRAKWAAFHRGFESLANRTLIVSCFKEDLGWLRQLPSSVQRLLYVHVDDESVSTAAPLDGYMRLVNHGREASAYLAFIVQHYDALPATMAFIMGERFAYHNANLMARHMPTWHNNGDLLALLQRLRWPEHREAYLPLNYQNYRCQSMTKWATDPRWTYHGAADGNFNASAVWEEVLQPYGLGPLRDVCYHCCSQFAVSRAAVRLRPREFYQKLLRLALRSGTSHVAWLLEYTWHLIFGLPAKMNKVDGCHIVERLPCSLVRRQ